MTNGVLYKVAILLSIVSIALGSFALYELNTTPNQCQMGEQE